MRRFALVLLITCSTVYISSCGGTTATPAPQAPTPSAAFAGNITAFLNTPVGTTSGAQSVVLFNSSITPLSVTGVTASGDFAETNTCGSSLTAPANCVITITFTPTAAGARTGTLTVTDNAPNSPQTIALTGTGTVPAATLSGMALVFASQAVGSTSAAQTITLTSSGTAPLLVAGITASGDFTETSTCGALVAPGAVCTISVKFAPTAIGARVGTLSIIDNAAGSPQTVALTGTAIAGGTPVLSGVATKGGVGAAVVTVFAVNADGTNGATLGTGITDALGNFSLALTSAPLGPIRVVITGGTYSSEWDATTVTSSSGISALIDDASLGVTGISVTAVSTFVDSFASGMLARGASSILTAHSTAEALIVSFYGFTPGTKLEALLASFLKSDITASPDKFKLGLIIGTLTEEGHALDSADPDALIAALASDISDGIWDGHKGAIVIMLGGLPMPSTAGDTDFLSDIGIYVASSHATTTAGIHTSDVSGLETTVAVGVDTCSCTPSAVGLAANSSGAINSLAFGGKQYLFIAARTNGVAVVDITDPTVTAPSVRSWPQIESNPVGLGGFEGKSVGGVAPFVGSAGHPQVLAFAYGSKHVIVLNASILATGVPGTDNPVDAEMDVPLVATSPVSFSGGSAFIGSAVPLGGPLLGLATADGYMVFDASQVPAAASVIKVYPVGDTTEIIAENLGDDLVDHLFLGGNEGASFSGGVQLVDLSAGLTSGTSYYITPANFSTAFPGTTSTAVDGNSVDPAYHVGILTFEDTGDAEFVNLATITKTPATSTALAMWAPAAAGTAHLTIGSTTLSGSAVDSTTHMALFMAGFSTDIAVGKLQDPASVPAGTAWQGMSDWSFYNINSSPSLSGYAEAHDPHADGVVFNLAKGTSYGYVLNGSDHGVVQTDLAGFMAIARTGTSGDAAHKPSADPTTVTNTTTGGKVMQQFTW